MTITDILSGYDEKIITLASSLRDLVLDRLKGATELPDSSAHLIGYGYGTGYKDLVCTILLSKNGIKLGFYKGTELNDPYQLLTGSGKMHKYVEIKSQEDIRNPHLKILLADALAAYQKRKK
jgi:Domain of unknown function (DU1801)